MFFFLKMVKLSTVGVRVYFLCLLTIFFSYIFFWECVQCSSVLALYTDYFFFHLFISYSVFDMNTGSWEFVYCCSLSFLHKATIEAPCILCFLHTIACFLHTIACFLHTILCFLHTILCFLHTIAYTRALTFEYVCLVLLALPQKRPNTCQKRPMCA